MPYMDNSNANRLIETYADMILRISYMYLKQTYDAEDICQDVFLKLLTGDFRFENPDHEKAWIIRTTINACKDHLRTSFWNRNGPVDHASEIPAPAPPESALLTYVTELPEKYRICIYLHYYEGYQVREIAGMLRKSESAVSACLYRGRKKLRQMMDAGPTGNTHERSQI